MRVLYVSPYFYPAMIYGGPIRSGRGLCHAPAAGIVFHQASGTRLSYGGPSVARMKSIPGAFARQ